MSDFETIAWTVDGPRIQLHLQTALRYHAFCHVPVVAPENWLPFAVPVGEKKWAVGI